MKKFKNFVEKYFKSDKTMLKKMLPLFDQRYVPVSSDKVNRICTNANSVNKTFKIPLEDAKTDANIKKFVDNFKSMQKEYIDSCKKLIDILEKKLLEMVESDTDVKEEKEENSKEILSSNKKEEETIAQNIQKYEIKNLSTDELKKQETTIRDIVGTLFVGCHRKYLDGVNYLDSYFYEKFNANVMKN